MHTIVLGPRDQPQALAYLAEVYMPTLLQTRQHWCAQAVLSSGSVLLQQTWHAMPYTPLSIVHGSGAYLIISDIPRCRTVLPGT